MSIRRTMIAAFLAQPPGKIDLLTMHPKAAWELHRDIVDQDDWRPALQTDKLPTVLGLPMQIDDRLPVGDWALWTHCECSPQWFFLHAFDAGNEACTLEVDARTGKCVKCGGSYYVKLDKEPAP